MRIKSFEDVLSWQEGRELYKNLDKKFATIKNFSFKDQLFRAALSVTNNIAEGFDRGSDKELKQLLFIARGSCAEVRSMLHTALDNKYINNEEHKELVKQTNKISKLLTGFINKLATNNKGQETMR